MAKEQPTEATNNSKMPYKLYPDDLPEHFEIVTVDVGQEFKLHKDIISKFVWVRGTQYWIARHHSTGIYYTSNPKDPKILNYAQDPDNPKCRGNIKFANGLGGNINGRPKGSRNAISVKQVLEKLNANPAELLAGVMTGDIHTLKRYGIRDPRNITVAQKLKCAETLLNKTVANLKPVDLDVNGEPMLGGPDREVEEKRSQIQVYLPSTGTKVSIDATEDDIAEIEEVGIDNYLSNHAGENLPYNEEDEEESLVWRIDK